MALYWRRKSIPELKGLPKDVRRRVCREAAKRAREDAAFLWLGIVMLAISLVTVLAAILISGIFTIAYTERDRNTFDIAMLIGTGVFTLVLLAALPWINHKLRPYIRECLTAGM
jgi:hypothetical protein